MVTMIKLALQDLFIEINLWYLIIESIFRIVYDNRIDNLIKMLIYKFLLKVSIYRVSIVRGVYFYDKTKHEFGVIFVVFKLADENIEFFTGNISILYS